MLRLLTYILFSLVFFSEVCSPRMMSIYEGPGLLYTTLPMTEFPVHLPRSYQFFFAPICTSSPFESTLLRHELLSILFFIPETLFHGQVLSSNLTSTVSIQSFLAHSRESPGRPCVPYVSNGFEHECVTGKINTRNYRTGMQCES